MKTIKLHKPDGRGNTSAGVDDEIAGLVQAINAGGIQTVASCSGHGHRPGLIMLEDGRYLLVMNREQAEYVGAMFPDIHGNWRA